MKAVTALLMVTMTLASAMTLEEFTRKTCHEGRTEADSFDVSLLELKASSGHPFDLQFQTEECERIAKARYHRIQMHKATTAWKQALEHVKEARSEYEQALSKRNSANSVLSAAKARLEAAKTNKAEATTKRDKAASDLQAAQTKLTELEKTAATRKAELAAAQAKADSAASARQQAEKEQQTAKEAFDKASTAATSAREEVNRLTAKVSSLTKQVAQHTNDVTSAENNLRESENRVNAREGDVTTKQKALDEAKKKRDEEASKAAAAKEAYDKAKSDLDTAAAARRTAEDALTAARSKKEEAQRKLTEAEQAAKAAQDGLKNAEAKLTQAKATQQQKEEAVTAQGQKKTDADAALAQATTKANDATLAFQAAFVAHSRAVQAAVNAKRIVDDLKARLEECQNEASRIAGELRGATETKTDREKAFADAQSDLDKLKEELTERREISSRQRRTRESVHSVYEKATADLARADADHKAKSTELAAANNKVADLTKKVEEAQTAATQAAEQLAKAAALKAKTGLAYHEAVKQQQHHYQLAEMHKKKYIELKGSAGNLKAEAMKRWTANTGLTFDMAYKLSLTSGKALGVEGETPKLVDAANAASFTLKHGLFQQQGVSLQLTGTDKFLIYDPEKFVVSLNTVSDHVDEQKRATWRVRKGLADPQKLGTLSLEASDRESHFLDATEGKPVHIEETKSAANWIHEAFVFRKA